VCGDVKRPHEFLPGDACPPLSFEHLRANTPKLIPGYVKTSFTPDVLEKNHLGWNFCIAREYLQVMRSSSDLRLTGCFIVQQIAGVVHSPNPRCSYLEFPRQ